METTIVVDIHGSYSSRLDGYIYSFPYYDEKTKSVNYHPSIAHFNCKSSIYHLNQAINASIDSDGDYISTLNGEKHSFPYYDEESKSVKYHPAVIGTKDSQIKYKDDGIWIKVITKYWYKNGKIHSYNDEPAVITGIGNREWYKDGKIHRDGDKPAIIQINGSMIYYKEGKIHRDNDKPAVIYGTGGMEYYKDGVEYKFPKVVNVELEKLEFHPIPGYQGSYIIKKLVPGAIFSSFTFDEIYVCCGKLINKDGGFYNISLTYDEIQLIESKGYKYENMTTIIWYGIPTNFLQSEESVEFHLIPGYTHLYYIKELVPYAIFLEMSKYNFLCCGKMENINGEYSEVFQLTPDDVKLINSKGYKYKYNSFNLQISFESIHSKSEESTEGLEVLSKPLEPLKPPEPLKPSEPSGFEITTETAIKFLLNCEELSKEEQGELIKNIFKDESIVSTKDVIKFLLNCKEINPTERISILRIIVNKK